MNGAKSYDLPFLISRFHIEGEYLEAEPHGNGHINDTYAVTFIRKGQPHRYILQRLNHHVFQEPEKLMENAKRICDELMVRLHEAKTEDPYRRALTIIPARDGKPYYRDEDGNYWRVFLYIEGAVGYDIVETEEHAYQAARAFGEFQKLLTDLPGERLHETIPGFHDTPRRLKKFKDVLAADPLGLASSAAEEIEFYLSFEEGASRLTGLHARGLIPERVTHNDTKLNNVLIDRETEEALCVIDLDTCMPGLSPYDFGDLMRTAVTPAAEDEKDLSRVVILPDMFRALGRGYLSTAAEFLTLTERENLVFGGVLMTYEVGLRFLTDYLEGDVYFKTKYPGHNLVRSRTQMTLMKALQEKQAEFEEFINLEYERILMQ